MVEVKCKYSKLVPINKVIEHRLNPNKHPERQIKMLAKIIEATGFRHPLIVSNLSGFLVAGHGRLAAAKELGMDKVPVDTQDFENEAEEYQFLVADNKIAELAEHDDSIMIAGIKELNLENIDFEMMGMPDFNLSLLTGDQDSDEKPPQSGDEKKFILEAQFPNEMEMMDVHDDLLHRGFIVKIK